MWKDKEMKLTTQIDKEEDAIQKQKDRVGYLKEEKRRLESEVK